MWGFTRRAGRFGDRRRPLRCARIGLTRVAIRGPVDHAVLELSGELDFSAVDDVRAVVSDLPHRFVAIDLTGLEFIDGAGAQLVHELSDDASVDGAPAPVLGTQSAVHRALRLVRARIEA